MIRRTVITASLIATTTFIGLATATAGMTDRTPDRLEATDAATTDAPQVGEDRLLIVNGKNGRVIYDDGRDDLYCVTRRVVVGYDDEGHPVRKRTLKCR